MPKRVKELGALEVQRLVKPGFYAVGVVPGLHLRVRSQDARVWILRVVVGSLRRDVGLGGFPAVTLSMARDKAREARELIAQGVDPVEHGRASRSAILAAQAKAVTFKDAADSFIKSNEAGWRNAKHGQQWRNTLEVYAFPVIGSLYVRDVEQAHILKILEPIWLSKTETATRVRGRIEKVLDWAKGRGYRSGDNPAAWTGNLDAQLPRAGKVAKSEHHPALPMTAVGAFMVALRASEGMGARALEFVILTAARSGDVRGATWGEIDLAEKIWAVPGARMKGGREHRVPLSPAAVKLLEALPRIAGTDLVFPAPRGGALSDMTLTAVIRRLNKGDAPTWVDPKDGRAITVHGFRSTFRDWSSERTSYPNEVCEMALAHAVRNAVEAAYRRGDLFEKRSNLMVDWAKFCARTAPTSATVIRMPKRAKG